MPSSTVLIRTLVSGAAVTALAVAGLATGVAPADAAGSPIKITRVYVDSPGSDLPVSNAKVNAEYTQLKNTGKSTVTLTGWTLRDKSNHVYTFGSFKLGAGKTVTVRNGKGKNTGSTRYWGSGYFIWNNSGGDAAILRNNSGKAIDSCSWKTVRSYVNC